jgi:hypothetical protein
MKALVDAIETPKNKQKNTPQEKYEERKWLVDRIYEKYWYKIPFDTLKEEEIPEEYIGSRVRISSTSEFAGQNDGEGIIFKKSSSRLRYHIRFDDGYENDYKLSDLIIIEREKSNGNDIEDIKKENQNILDTLAKEKDKDFIDRITISLFNTSQKDKELLNRIFPNEKFNEWDDIIMNEYANSKYNHSKEWSTGVIISKNRYDFNVRFDKITSREYTWEKNPVWEIEAKYMTNLSAKPDRKITLKDISKKIAAIVKSLKDKKESEKDDVDSEKRKELATKLLLQENFLLPGDSKWSYVLNYHEMVKFIAPKLYAAYGNKNLYSQEDMCAPPSECHPNVLKLELSRGCNYNRCTYCDLYKDVKYCPRTFEEFKVHVDKVIQSLEDYKRNIERLFIGGGNALAVDEKTLLDSLNYINNKIRLKRIAMYARTQDINRKWSEWLQKLYKAGLTNLYRWAETWSDEILKYIKKWTTSDDMLKASENLSKTKINLSVTLMPGIWGKRFDEENIKW